MSQSIKKQLVVYSERLLSMSTRNKLIHSSFSSRELGFRFIDELPQKLALKISKPMEFTPLPALESEPPEEKKPIFKRKVEKLKLVDDFYLKEMQEIDSKDLEDPDEISELEADALRNLKDRLRVDLGLPPRVFGRGESDLRKHAISFKINPSYDLPEDSPEIENEARFNDLKIQTLMLPDVLEAKLTKLKQRHKTNLEETGQNTLYLCFGFLEWIQMQGVASKKKRLAPLLMMQVKFDLDKKKDLKIQAVDDNEIIENKTLKLYLQDEFGIKLPAPPVMQIKNGNKEYEVKDIEKYLSKVNKLVQKNRDWKVLRRASIGIFHTQELTMHEDLKSIAENPNDLLKKLLSGKSLPGSDEIYDVDQKTYRELIPALIEPADSSQHSAIIDMLKGDSFVLRGPPGTGKSQTICNMIAAGLYSGKKVLFVADKEAALEVVRTRLKAAGLDEYVLKLYSAKASKNSLWDSVKQRLNTNTPQSISNKLDPKIVELTEVRENLNEYKDFIGSDFGKTGVKIHDLLWNQELLKNKYLLNNLIKIDFPKCDQLEADEKERIIDSLNSIAQQFEIVFNETSHRNHPWNSAKKPPTTTIERDNFRGSIQEWIENLNSFQEDYKSLIKIGLPEEAFVLEDLRKISFLAKTIKLTGEVSETREFADLLHLTLFRSDKDIKDMPNLIDGIEKSLEKRAKINSSPLDESAGEILEYSGIILALISEGQYLEEFREFTRETAKDIAQEEGQFAPFKRLYENLELKEPFEVSSIELLKKLFFNHQDRWQISKLRGRLADKGLKKKILLIKNAVRDRLDIQAKQIDLNYLDSVADLRNAALTIRSSSFFSIFNKDYRTADKTLKRVCQDPLSKKEKIKILELVARYKEADDLFHGDLDLMQIFDTHTLFDVNSLNCAVVYQTLEKLSDLSLTEISDPIFNSFNNSPGRFIEYLTELSEEEVNKFPIGNYEKHENIFEVIKTKKEDYIKLDYVSELIESKNLSQFSILSIQEFLKSIDDLKELELENESTINQLFDKKIPLNIIVENLSEFKEWLTQLLDINQDQRTLFTNNSSLLESYPLVNKFTEDLESSIKNLFDTANLIEARVFVGISEDKISYRDLMNFTLSHLNSGPINEFFDLKREELSLPSGSIKEFYKAFLKTENKISDIPNYFESWLVQKQYRKLLEDKTSATMLNTYKGRKLNSLVDLLKKLDTEIQTYIRSDIKKRANIIGDEAPAGNGGKSGDKTEGELLSYGNSLKTFPKGSVRNHINRSSEALSFNLPCWMITPPNISTYVPLTQEFDLLIIDEASQMSPARALPAVARAKQCIIVGDENQLPPTSFFSRVEDDDNDVIDVQESILDLAKTIWTKPRLLRWHYRSKHQDLIRFQNNFIYDNLLIIPPSTYESEDNHLGVHSHYLENAIYRTGGTNDDEVDKIIELVEGHATKKPKKSLGIAVMNVRQRDNVEQEINLLYQQNSKVRRFLDYWNNAEEGLNKFFIKNLENVQGDERDVIIVGTGFGRLTSGAPVLQRFHPINQMGGERRLNVITTRARESLHLVTSLTSSDVKTNSKGTRFLSEYISYAKTKDLPLGRPTGEGTDSPFEDWAIGEIESMGFIAVPQVGVQGFKIDIGVKHPDADGYILAVECDGATYHSSPAARDRDLLRQQLLESFNWKFHRIWSTDWIWETEKTTEKLRSALKKSLIEATRDNAST